MSRQPAVYILASGYHGTLYAGVTSDLVKRTWQHREHVVEGFTERYDVINLVWYELHESMVSAIEREKRIKKWNRAWKIRMIEEQNPKWMDLWASITGASELDSRLTCASRSAFGPAAQFARCAHSRGNDET